MSAIAWVTIVRSGSLGTIDLLSTAAELVGGYSSGLLPAGLLLIHLDGQALRDGITGGGGWTSLLELFAKAATNQS
jgi:hypothetical protein